MHWSSLLLLLAIQPVALASVSLDISRFIDQRCNRQNKPSIWIYEGTLTDPTTGRIVAHVEGLELAHALPEIQRESYNDGDGSKQLMNNLVVGKLLQNSEWDKTNTILSRKLFCYKRHSNQAFSSNNKSSKGELLTSIRLRPDGPLRHLSPTETVAIYDSAVTFIQRGNDLVMFSENGGTHTNNPYRRPYVMGSTEATSSDDTFEYTINARKGMDQNPKLPPLQSSEEVTISPQRSRLVQFGKSQEVKKYDAVRETYSYFFGTGGSSKQMHTHEQRNGNRKFSLLLAALQKSKKTQPQSKEANQCTVRYTRYGEAPPWYAPGRMCTLDLVGRRVETSQLVSDNENENGASTSLSPILKWTLEKCNPSFWTGWPSVVKNNDRDAVRAIKSFYTDSTCCINYNVHREQSQTRVKMEKACGKVLAGVDRLKQSLIINDDNK